MNVETLLIPSIVLVIGILAGIGLVYLLPKPEKKTGAKGETNDLQSATTSVLSELHALEMQQQKLSDADYSHERQALLNHGAEALRRLDLPATSQYDEEQAMSDMPTEEQQIPGKAAEDTPPKIAAQTGIQSKTPWISPRWEGAFWALGCVAVLGGLYLALSYGLAPTKPRDDAGPAAAQNVPVSDGAREQAALAVLEKDPNDIKALNTLCWATLHRRNDLQGAIDYNERARAIDPKNPDTRFHHALLMFMQRKPSLANQELDAIIAEHPDHVGSLEFRGLFYVQEKKFEEGRALIERAEKSATEGPTRMRLRRLLSQVDGAIAAQAQDSEIIASGTLQVKDEAQLKDLPSQAVIYISMRDPNGGPPLGAKKLPVGPFPLSFTLTGQDRIAMGTPRPIPANFNLSIRVDEDGNPMTKEVHRPSASLTSVAKGTEGMEITLTVGSQP